MKSTFRTDRRNGKLLGVCAGIANMTGWDPTLVRVAAVLVTVLGAFPWILIAYAVAAWAGSCKGSESLSGRDEARRRHLSADELRSSMRDIDRRMSEVDLYVASPNRSLAQEIDSLR